MAADRDHLEASPLTALSVERVWHFRGVLSDVSEARDRASEFLYRIARTHPPATPDAHDDALLVVTELASNAFSFAPGPFTLNLRAMTGGTLHVGLTDTNPTAPRPRAVSLAGRGGVGWHLINTLADQVITVPEGDGKTVHVFLPW
ncbi:ATP-binding protein [Streptomyces flavidovirens]|uniref:ATP-binding protein n=1 Tax=Streptomyces flavidovirens TaxID=67298 RepID=UPI001FCA8E01|nr:ATP-binding protein [Streptomyces flavidovirens]